MSCTYSFPRKSISASRTRARAIFKSLSAFVSKLDRNLSRYFSTTVADLNAIHFGMVSAYLLSRFSWSIIIFWLSYSILASFYIFRSSLCSVKLKKKDNTCDTDIIPFHLMSLSLLVSFLPLALSFLSLVIKKYFSTTAHNSLNHLNILMEKSTGQPFSVARS